MAQITIANLEKVYHSQAHAAVLQALERVSFDVADQEFVCILGPSGCGKSTILNILSGLDNTFQGDIRVAGQPLGGGHGVRAGVDVELAHDVLDVGAHRLGGEDERVCNVICRLAGLEELDDLPFARGQRALDRS